MKSSFSTVGCRTVRGNCGSTRLMRSRTSWAAMSAFFSSLNETTTCEMPSDEVDVSVSMPLMVLTDSSILSVTSVSICSGAAPGRRVVTEIVGMSTLGKRSTPRRPKANSPTTRQRQDEHPGEDRTPDAEFDASHCMAYLATTRTPSTSRSIPAATTRSPAFRPLAISIAITDHLAGSDDALFDTIGVDDEHAGGPRDGANRRRRDQHAGNASPPARSAPSQRNRASAGSTHWEPRLRS